MTKKKKCWGGAKNKHRWFVLCEYERPKHKMIKLHKILDSLATVS